MKPLGSRKTHPGVAGHQHCAICHPETTKGGRARDARAERALEREAWELQPWQAMDER